MLLHAMHITPDIIDFRTVYNTDPATIQYIRPQDVMHFLQVRYSFSFLLVRKHIPSRSHNDYDHTMRLSFFYLTLGLALLAFSAPLDDSDNPQVKVLLGHSS